MQLEAGHQANVSQPRRIRVSSRALGPKLTVTVLVYDDLADMQRAASAWNGEDQSEAAAVCHYSSSIKTNRVVSVLVRLARSRLGTEVVVHEMHHASTALYGAHVRGERISRLAHLNNHNEPFAYLHSDLVRGLVDRLYALGYYGTTA